MTRTLNRLTINIQDRRMKKEYRTAQIPSTVWASTVNVSIYTTVAVSCVTSLKM